MKNTDVIIIGGGQAGLAMSRCLTERAIDHVVLERGRVGERWRSERWDSLRLLTPRWQSRLPGYRYQGPDPDGFMAKHEVIDLLEDYSRSIAAPVHTGVTVTAVERNAAGYRIATDQGDWHAANVVVATGHCDIPHVPDMAASLSPDVAQVVPSRYRNPDQLPAGGVLVIGASATGIQLAAEIHRSGRPVTLAVGRHIRLPRRYRGRDILYWLDAMGTLNQSADEVFDLEASRRQPSLQLIGSPAHRPLDLGVLAASGVRLVGRAAAAAGARMTFAPDLAGTVAAADAKLARQLRRIDDFIARVGLSAEVPPAAPVAPIRVPAAPEELDLAAEGIRTVVWATGYRRSYPWLRVPVLDERGEIRHTGGVTAAEGLYVLGLMFLRRRNSSFIDGVGADARHLAGHIACRMARVHEAPATVAA